MSQPRKSSPFRSLSERFSKHKYYTTERYREPHRSHSRKLAKEKTMSGALPIEMDIDSGSTDRHSIKSGQREGTFLGDEKTEEPFEIVNYDTLRDGLFYTHQNKPLELNGESNNIHKEGASDVEIVGVKETQTTTDLSPDAEKSVPDDSSKKTTLREGKKEEIPDLKLQFQQLMNEYGEKMSALSSKINNLESSSLQQPSIIEGHQSGEDSGLSNELRQKYEERILTLEKVGRETEQQIHSLLNAQEKCMKYQTELEARYRGAINTLEKEKSAREESELGLRTDITTIRGAYQKEKERAQKLMKTMAEMQNADPFKMDNTSITSLVKELRYDIKNWARAQKLIPSLPAQGLISTYANKALGGRDRGPNYEFLKEVTPVFHEYTESPQDFKYVLQAYIWKRIVELVIVEDLWAGTRKSIDDDESEYKLQLGYRHMKMKLTPEDEANQEYIAQFHDWRSTSARILEQRISPARRKRTVELIRDEILRPFLKAAEPMEQEFRNIEDFEAIVESAMRLGATMAQQKAYFMFEFVSLSAYGKMEFRPQHMTDPFPAEHFDPRTQVRAVWLNLAPRLMKHGTSEGTNFDSCVQLLEGEVETRIVPRKFAVRRQVVN